MTLVELFFIAVGLSMDAFAVALCKGLSLKNASINNSLTVGLYFGISQGIMPLLGYWLGSQFADKIYAFDHWVAFVLLAVIGAKMIIESRKKEETCAGDPETLPDRTAAVLAPRRMLPLALATSIDALAVGISFAFLNVRIIPAVCIIGIITLGLSMAGVKIGRIFGSRFKARAELAGGVILCLMGLKILLEHTGVIAGIF